MARDGLTQVECKSTFDRPTGAGIQHLDRLGCKAEQLVRLSDNDIAGHGLRVLLTLALALTLTLTLILTRALTLTLTLTLTRALSLTLTLALTLTHPSPSPNPDSPNNIAGHGLCELVLGRVAYLRLELG